MILTVTLNPSIDKLYLVDELCPAEVMRVKAVRNTAGGKGLNVSRVAALAGAQVQATGFVGGFNGQYLCSLLRGQGVVPDFCEVAAETRTCINIRELKTGKHTELLEPGATVSEENIRTFLDIFERALPRCAVVTISGSVPQGVPEAFYTTLIQMAQAQQKAVLLDTSGAQLKAAVSALPTLIKPNSDEIVQLLGEKPTSQEALLEAARQLHAQGIAYVVVSLGGDGALLVCDAGCYKADAPAIAAVNTVGCGDSMLAGFAVGLSRHYGAEELLRFATAIASANAMTMETGFFRQEDFERLLGEVQILRYRS